MKIRTGVYIELEPGDLVARQGCVTYISTPKRLIPTCF